MWEEAEPKLFPHPKLKTPLPMAWCPAEQESPSFEIPLDKLLRHVRGVDMGSRGAHSAVICTI